ncbi:MAG: histidine phosphatase family protein [Campylobacterales bacterium]|nr:histidine phosphatase family protein [Campylobacterales bacterium]
MKKLYIIRHAKSSWKDMSLSDFERPLNKRGKNNAKFMGEFLAHKRIKSDSIISSPAKRAMETSIALAKELDYSMQRIVYRNDIYEASVNALLDIIASLDNEDDCVFLIGHNPSLNLLLDRLIPDNAIENIVTTGIVELELHIDRWRDVSPKSTCILSFEYPKKYLTMHSAVI